MKTKKKNLSMSSLSKRKMNRVVKRREKKRKSMKIRSDAMVAHTEVDCDRRMSSSGRNIMNNGSNDDVPYKRFKL